MRLQGDNMYAARKKENGQNSNDKIEKLSIIIEMYVIMMHNDGDRIKKIEHGQLKISVTY